MTNSPAENITFALIIVKLQRLTDHAKGSNQNQSFRRLTMNHRILAQLQANVYSHDSSSQEVSAAEILMLKRGAVFNWASLQPSINFFSWARLSTVQELAEEAYRCAKENSLLLPLMALRSILEVTGNVVLLTKDLERLAEPNNEITMRMEHLTEFESLVDGRLAGLRVDYSALTKHGLRGARKLAYKPGEFESDQTAKDLLKGVDLLDKRVRGARATYDFLSEFAHPNLASVWTHYDRIEPLIKVMDIHGYAVHHKRRTIGEAFMNNFGAVVAKSIDILDECVNELLSMDTALRAKGEQIARHAKKAIREVIRHDPSAFDSREDCPCNSGINIRQCCGKLINTSNFGEWPSW